MQEAVYINTTASFIDPVKRDKIISTLTELENTAEANNRAS